MTNSVPSRPEAARKCSPSSDGVITCSFIEIESGWKKATIDPNGTAYPRSGLPHDVDEVVPVALVAQAGEIVRIGRGVVVRVRLGPRVALEQKGRCAERVEHLPERSTPDLAVVRVEHHVLAIGDDEEAVVDAVLVRRNVNAGGELDHLAVR